MSESLAASLHPRYTLENLLGRGALGEVWAVVDNERNERLALKRVPGVDPHSGFNSDAKQLEAEVAVLARLSHPGVVRIVDSCLDREPRFFTMELLEGVSFEDAQRAGLPGPAEIEGLVRSTQEILAALDAVHSRGVLHGDLKPSNIFLVAGHRVDAPTWKGLIRDAQSSVRLLDFGLARRRGRGIAPEDTAGTPLYMAPEQLAGRAIMERSDLYSLGAILYHLIGGRPPFLTLNEALTRSPPPPELRDLNARCSPALESFVLSLLETDPELRPASAAVASRTLPASPRLLDPVFVGRTAELATLREAREQILVPGSSTGQIVVVEGPRACGKTWLLERSSFAIESRLRSDLTSLRVSLRASTGPGGVRSLLGSLERLRARRSDEARSDAAAPTETVGASFRGLVGSRRGSSGSQSVSESLALRESVLSSALRLLRECARLSPLVLFVEDVEAATELDVELLARVSRSIQDLPILLVVSRRTGAGEELAHLEAWLEELDQRTLARRLPLDGLSDGAVYEYARSVISPLAHPDDALVEWISHHPDTRPSTIHSRLGRLLTAGELELRSDRWHLVTEATVDTGALPPADRDSLSPEERRLLSAIALLQPPISLDDIAELLEQGPGSTEKLEARLHRLIQSGHLHETDEGFDASREIDVTRSTETNPFEIDELQITRLHARAAERLLRRDRPLGETEHARLGQHKQAVGDDNAAASHWIEAARLAAHGFANRRARRLLESAVDVLENLRSTTSDGSPGSSPSAENRDRLRARARFDLGALYVRLGEYDRALECFRICETLEPLLDDTATSLRDRIGRVLHRKGELEQAKEYYLRSFDDAHDDPDANALAEYRLGSIAFDTHDFDLAREHFDRSLAAYGSSASSEKLVPVLLGLGLVRKIAGDVEGAIESFEKALRAARAAGQLVDEARILGNLGNLYRANGDAERALEHLELSTKTRELVGDRQGLAICLNNISRVHAHRGNLQSAHEVTVRSLEVFRDIGDQKGILIAQCNLGEVLLGLGRVGEAREALEEGLALSEKLGVQRMTENFLSNLSAAALAAGAWDRAIELGRRCLHSLPEGKLNALRAEILTTIGVASIESNRLEEAQDRLAEAERAAQSESQYEKRAALARARMRLARLRGDPRQAVRIGKAILSDLRPSDERLGIALLELELGVAYRDLGPDWADRTEKHLAHARRDFDAMGCALEGVSTRVEQAIYWRFVEEFDLAKDCFDESESMMQNLRAQSPHSDTGWIERFNERLRARIDLEAGTL